MEEAFKSTNWQADLTLEFAPRAGKTRKVTSKRLGPLTVQRAFFPEGNVNHTYLLHPPGGVVGGDQLNINIKVQEAGQVLITTPGATKFYRSEGKKASVEQCLHVEAGSSLEWMPLEGIFFSGASVGIKTQVHLSGDAKFIGWEMNCLGRPANEESFATGTINSHFACYRDGRLVMLDRFATAGESMMNSPVGMRGYSGQAMLIATMDDESVLLQVQTMLAVLAPKIWAGATCVDGLLVVRLLANQSQDMLGVLVAVWNIVRPVILGRETQAPRIWAT